MEPVSIVVICAASFGGLMTLASVIHQYFLSRNQRLHQLAEERAVRYQQKALERLRNEIRQNQFKQEYHLLDENKEAITHLDEEIHKLMTQKITIIQRFSKLMDKEVKRKRERFFSSHHQKKINTLKEEMSLSLSLSDQRIKTLQDNRGDLLQYKKHIEKDIRQKEIEQNKALNTLYEQHGAFLEKIQLKQAEYRFSLANSIVSATTSLFDKLIMAPAKFIAAYFSPSSNINSKKPSQEVRLRANMLALENRLNIGFETDLVKAELSI